jgi:hypothetical protein
MPYKNYIISKGGQELGITWYDIENHILTPAQFKEFNTWMNGQTVGCIDDSCTTGIVYTGDLLRFIKGLPVID